MEMTIAVCIWVPEGIVFASESRQVYENQKGNYRISSDFTQKVFQLSARIGGVTCGRAYLSKKGVLSLIEEFKASAKASGSNLDEIAVKDLADRIGAFFQSKWQEQAADSSEGGASLLSLVIGGYENGVNRIFEVSIPGPSIVEISTLHEMGAAWRGQTDVVTRLIKGFDPRISRLSWFQPSYAQELEKLKYMIGFDAMTLQDAIDFAIFLIRTTIDMQRFSDGIALDPGDIPGTGGPIDIAIIRPNEGFAWVQRKELRGETLYKRMRMGES
jgi:20S proteasome alpha/beta subunit